MIGKKGVAWWSIILAGLAVLVVGFIIYGFAAGEDKAAADESILEDVFTSKGGETLDIENMIKSDTLRKPITFIFKYVFGMHKGVLEDLGVEGGDLDKLSIRGLMILIAVWVVFFLIISDMTLVFGGFSNKVTGFLIGLAIAVIFANFGIYYHVILALMGVFSFAAGISVILALVSILVLGVGAHFGAGWAKARIKTKKDIWKIASGADKAAAGVGVAKKMGEAAGKGE